MAENLEKAIEAEIKKLLGQLRPEITKQANFMFSEAMVGRNENEIKLADTNYALKPPQITFYLGSISRNFKDMLLRLVNHEIIHAFYLGEKEAEELKAKINFMKKPPLKEADKNSNG